MDVLIEFMLITSAVYTRVASIGQYMIQTFLLRTVKIFEVRLGNDYFSSLEFQKLCILQNICITLEIKYFWNVVHA